MTTTASVILCLVVVGIAVAHLILAVIRLYRAFRTTNKEK